MVDNRFLIANLISCSTDTPRVAGDCDVFAIQDRVIDDILGSVREQQAVDAAPRILDPLQQTVITLLRSYLNSPAAKRTEVREATVLRAVQRGPGHRAGHWMCACNGCSGGR